MLGLPMMAYGLFIFQMETLPYQDFKQRYGWRWASNSRVGPRLAYQYIGKDEESITLSGVLLPELTGGDLSLALLRLMGDQAKAWPLLEGTGAMYGFFIMESMEVTRSEFFSDGKARRLEFTITLKRIDNSLMELLGIATSAILALAA